MGLGCVGLTEVFHPFVPFQECGSCYKVKYKATKNVQEFVTELPSAVKGWALLLEPFDLHKVDRFLQTVYGPRKAKSEE